MLCHRRIFSNYQQSSRKTHKKTDCDSRKTSIIHKNKHSCIEYIFVISAKMIYLKLSNNNTLNFINKRIMCKNRERFNKYHKFCYLSFFEGFFLKKKKK